MTRSSVVADKASYKEQLSFIIRYVKSKNIIFFTKDYFIVFQKLKEKREEIAKKNCFFSLDTNFEDCVRQEYD